MPSSPSRPAALPALTGIRFVAAFIVLLFHTAPESLRGLPLIGIAISHGYVGVSCFFVLSGFILAHNYLGRDVHIRRGEFWKARFARVYPMYAFALVASAPFLLYATLASTSGLAARVWPPLITAPLLAQSWLPRAAACAWNCPGWSLSTEAFFYLCFPFLGELVRAARTRTLALLVVLLSAAAAMPGVIAIAAGVPSHGAWTVVPYLEYLPPLRLSEFALGAVLGVLFGRRAARDALKTGWGVGAAVLGLSIIAVLATPGPLLDSHLFDGALALPFGAFIYTLARTRGPAAGLASRAGVRLGEASYALYLLHVPLEMWFRSITWRGAAGGAAIARWLALPRTESALSAIGKDYIGTTSGWASYCVLTLALSVLALRYVEEPARRLLRARLATPANRPWARYAALEAPAPDVRAEP